MKREHFTSEAYYFTREAYYFTGEAYYFTGEAYYFTGEAEHFPREADYFTGEAAHLPREAEYLPREAEHFTREADYLTRELFLLVSKYISCLLKNSKVFGLLLLNVTRNFYFLIVYSLYKNASCMQWYVMLQKCIANYSFVIVCIVFFYSKGSHYSTTCHRVQANLENLGNLEKRETWKTMAFSQK